MSNIFEPTKIQIKELNDWKLTRPKIIQDMIDKFPPHKLYRLKETNQNVTVYSYAENGTLAVNIYSIDNPHLPPQDFQVFGIQQDSLEESDFIREHNVEI